MARLGPTSSANLATRLQVVPAVVAHRSMTRLRSPLLAVPTSGPSWRLTSATTSRWMRLHALFGTPPAMVVHDAQQRSKMVSAPSSSVM